MQRKLLDIAMLYYHFFLLNDSLLRPFENCECRKFSGSQFPLWSNWKVIYSYPLVVLDETGIVGVHEQYTWINCLSMLEEQTMHKSVRNSESAISYDSEGRSTDLTFA